MYHSPKEKSIKIKCDIKFHTLYSEIISSCMTHLSKRKWVQSKKGSNSQVGLVTHPTLAYLKRISLDLISVFESHLLTIDCKHPAIKVSKEYDGFNIREVYIEELMQYYSHVSKELQHGYRTLFNHVYPYNSATSEIDPFLISRVGYIGSLCRDTRRKSVSDMSHMLLTYLVAQHPSSIWLYNDLGPDTLSHKNLMIILDPILNQTRPIETEINNINFVVGSNIWNYCRSQEEHCYSDQHMTDVVYADVVFVTTILHLMNVIACCEIFKFVEYGLDFVKLANDLRLYIEAIIEWKLLCRD